MPLKINHNLYSYSDKPAFKGDKNEIQHTHPYNPQVQSKDAFKLQSKDAQNKQGFLKQGFKQNRKPSLIKRNSGF